MRHSVLLEMQFGDLLCRGIFRVSLRRNLSMISPRVRSYMGRVVLVTAVSLDVSPTVRSKWGSNSHDLICPLVSSVA